MRYEKVVTGPKERRIKSMLRERGLDGVIVSSPGNFHYAAGSAGRQHTVSRQPGFALAVVFSDDRTTTQLTTMGYEGLTFGKRVREQKERLGEEASELVARPYGTQMGVETWDEATGAAKIVGKQSMEPSFDMSEKMARDMDLTHKRLGVELAYLNVFYFRQLQETFPETKFVDISSMFVLARSMRAENEVQMFRALCRIVDGDFYQVSRMIQLGVREREMADHFRQSVIATGFCISSLQSMFSTSPSGTRLTLPEDGTIESTHMVKYDAGVNTGFNLYTVDTSRAWVMKDAAPELLRLKGRLYEGQRGMIVAARPGFPVCELFRTAYEYVREQYPCYGRDHCGHSINLGPAMVEELHINTSAERLLEPDMILTMEVPCYMWGVSGFSVEDMMLIMEDGSEVLTPRALHYLQGTSHFRII